MMANLRASGVQNVMRNLDTDELVGQRKVNGKKRLQPLGTTDLANVQKLGTDANDLLREFLGKNKREFPKNVSIKHGDAFDIVLEQGVGPKSAEWAPSTKKKMKQLYRDYARDLLGHKRVVDITKWDIIEVLERAKKDSEYFKKEFELKPSQRRNLYVALSTTFTMMTQPPLEFTSYNPVGDIGKIHRPDPPKGGEVGDDILILDHEVVKIADSFTARGERKSGEGRRGSGNTSTRLAYTNRVLFELLIETGMRITEALALGVDEHVRYAKGSLHLVGDGSRGNRFPNMILCERRLNTNYDEKEGTKYKADDPTTWFAPLKGDVGKTIGQKRRIPLYDEGKVSATLGLYIETGLAEGWLHEGGLLFPNTRGRPNLPQHFWAALQDAVKRAGITRHITTHFTRHTALSAMVEEIENENDMAVVAEIAGHDVKVLTGRYNHRRENSKSYDKIREAQRRREERRAQA